MKWCSKDFCSEDKDENGSTGFVINDDELFNEPSDDLVV